MVRQLIIRSDPESCGISSKGGGGSGRGEESGLPIPVRWAPPDFYFLWGSSPPTSNPLPVLTFLSFSPPLPLHLSRGFWPSTVHKGTLPPLPTTTGHEVQRSVFVVCFLGIQKSRWLFIGYNRDGSLVRRGSVFLRRLRLVLSISVFGVRISTLPELLRWSYDWDLDVVASGSVYLAAIEW